MIDLNITVSNPLRSGRDAWASDWVNHDTRVTRHKNLEIQVARWSRIVNLFELEVSTRMTGRDHAGPRFYASLLGFFLSVQLYDGRHWDYANDRWEAH